MKKKASTLTFLTTLTCLSCNPLVVDKNDAGVDDAGIKTEKQTSYVFEPTNITIATAPAE